MHRAVWIVVLTLVLLIGAVSTPSAQTNSQSDALLQEQGLSWINVQARLNDAGYDAGPADGFPGNLTRSALARFQRDNGLVASGQIDQLTIGALQNMASAGASSVICSDEGGENIRFGPSARDFDVIVRLPNGTPINVLERVTNQSGYDYLRIAYGSGQNGFIWHESVAPSCGSATAQAVPQPSFNCAAASTPTERAICGSTALATLDVEMAAAYSAALESSSNSQAVRQSQVAWLGTRDTCGSDIACLSRAMSARTSELQRLGDAPATAAVTAQAQPPHQQAPIQSLPRATTAPVTASRSLRDQTYDLCRAARTRAQKGQCLLTAIINHEGGGILRTNGLVLEQLRPSTAGFPYDNRCARNINNALSMMSLMRLSLNLSRADQVAFADFTMTCQSNAYLERQLFGRTLTLSDCLPTITDQNGLTACLDNIEDVYSRASLNEMRDFASELFQRRIGMVPDVIARGFFGQTGQEAIEKALNEDLQFCIENAQARSTSSERREAFGSNLGNILANAIFSQMDSPTQRDSGVDRFGLQRIVTCDMAANLGQERGGQFAQLAQEFLTKQVVATANICDPANATRMPDETVVGTLLNNRLLSTCTRTGMLAEMMEDARNQSGAGGNPGALLAFDFRALNNQCQIFLTGTQVFTASYSIPSARSIEGTIDGSGTATFTAVPNYNCNYFDDRPGFEQAFCAPVRAFPAPFAITAQWSSQSCTWEARSVDRIRN